MIAHHEVGFRRNNKFGHGAAVVIHERDISLVQEYAVDPDLAAVDDDAVAGKANDALDVAFSGSRG